MAPAIRAAADGFEVDAYFALQALEHLEALRAQPEAAALYLERRACRRARPSWARTTLAVPPRLRQPELARTLELVAGARRAPGSTSGEIAAAIERHFAERGGLLTRADLAAYAAARGRAAARAATATASCWLPRSPCGRLDRRARCCACSSASRRAPRRSRRPRSCTCSPRHRRTRSPTAIAWLGDPDAVPVPLGGLLSDGYADEVAERIRTGAPAPDLGATTAPPWEELAFRALSDPWRHDPRPGPPRRLGARAPPTVARDDHGTTHFAVTDRDGMTVSCTHTAANALRLEGRGGRHRPAVRRVDGVVQRRPGRRELDRPRPRGRW